MRRLLLLLIILVLSSFCLAEDFHYQGFENTVNDNWNFTPNPAPTSRLIWWGRLDQPMGGATAQTGDWYWGSWDLDNLDATLTFDTVILPVGYTCSLSFWYYTNGLDAETEFTGYSYAFDTDTLWTDWTALAPNTQAWTQVSIAIPYGMQQFRLQVKARHNGLTKYAHFDNFTLAKDLNPPTPPQISNLTVSQLTDGSGLVDIYYDIYDVNGNSATVSLLLTQTENGPFDYIPDPTNLSGDVGDSISIGTGKHIIWNAGAENTDFETEFAKVRLVADDTTFPPVAVPVFSPPSGTYYDAQMVTITCATENTVIHYTLDGSEPTELSPVYTEPLIVSTATTIKAKAFRPEWTPSETTTAAYDIRFVFVEGGTFNNGTAEVSVSSFWLDKYELTQAEYEAVMGINPAHDYGVGITYPVYNVSWFNAIEYCNRRSVLEGLTPVYSYNTFGTNPNNWPLDWNSVFSNHVNLSCNWTANGYRLPTEAEWVFAARGGNLTTGYTYSGSNDIDAVGWYVSNSGQTTHSYGQKAPNELGLYDLTGNVREWNWDIYGPLPTYAQENPTGAQYGNYRLEHGGGWEEPQNWCTTDNRSATHANYSYVEMGFRVLKSIPWVGAPVITPPAGTYITSQQITITCDTFVASIYYTTDGSEPSQSSNLYVTPFAISGDVTIKAKAFLTGTGPSATVSAAFSGISLVEISGGTFWNGASYVTLDDYYIGKYEVTQGEYETVMSSNPAQYYGVGTDNPVYFVSWFNAIEYCNKRSLAEGFSPVYSYASFGANPANWPAGWNADNANQVNVSCDWTANGYRLPTEMEWMYAAREGELTHNYVYSGSNNISNVAWYSANAGYNTHQVGTKVTNALNLYDLSGNLFELCWDKYGYYPIENQTNPHGPEGGNYRILRGGAFTSGSYYCTIDYRTLYTPTLSTNIIGFRVCRNASDFFVTVPGGTFQMGAAYADSVHTVTLSSFQIGKYEVTQGEWSAVMGTNPSFQTGDSFRPVDSVTWYSAIAFCNRKSALSGLTPCYTYAGYGTDPANWPAGWNTGAQNYITCDWNANGYRLPTEAEWEYAARGASGTPDYWYAGSDDVNSVAWYFDNALAVTHPVGKKAPNSLGLYDMSGNVWEWCWDWFAAYTSEPQTNPTGPLYSGLRIFRGGGKASADLYCRVAYRNIMYPDYGDSQMGFRLCRKLP